MAQVVVLGWYGHANIGDEAYKLAYPAIFPDVSFTFQDNLDNIERPDAVILGGGDVINESFFIQIKKFTKKFPDVPIYAMSVNVNPKVDCSIFKKMFVRSLVTDTDQVIYMPDFTFVLKPNPERGQRLIKKIFKDYNAELYDKIVIVTMNTYLCYGDNQLARDHVNFERVCFEIGRMIDETAASFLLLPFGNSFPINDRVANSYLYSKCKWWRKVCLYFGNLSVQDTLDVISAANVVIGTRLHALVFACIGSTPFISLQHHDKTKCFLETVGRTAWKVEYWKFCRDRLTSLLDKMLEKKELREELAQITTMNKGLLKKLPGLVNF